MDYLQIPLEIKAVDDDGDGYFTFEGMASTFGNVDQGGDVVQFGAFSNSLTKRLPVILWQHDSSEPIGMPTELKETNDGLFIRGRLPKDDDFVRGRVIPQMRVGSLKKMSIGFNTLDYEISKTGIRTLKELDLWEVSLVTFPMNELASVSGFKSQTGQKMFNLEDVEHIDGIKSLREFFKSSDIFTKKALEKVLSQFSDLGDPESKSGDLGDPESQAIAELKAAFQSLNNNLTR